MPDFRLGTAAPTALRLGTTPVSKMYRGTTQVWPNIPPAAPLNLVAVSGGATSAALTWDAVAGATGYVVEYRKTKAKSVQFSDEFTYANGRLVDVDGAAPWSAAVNGTGGALGTVDVASGWITPRNTTDDSLVVGPAHSSADGYVEITLQSSGGSFIGAAMRNTGAPDRTEIVGECTPTNRFQIGEFRAGNETFLAFTADSYLVPNTIYRLRLECIGLVARLYLDDVMVLTGDVHPSFTAPGYVRTGGWRNGPTARTDRFEMGTFAVGAWTAHSTPSGTSATVGSLATGEQYDFRVAATNPAGTSAWSSVDSAVPGVGVATISGVAPSSATANGGIKTTVTGTNFAPDATSVTFDGGAPITAVVKTFNTLDFTSPAHAAGTSALRVVTPNGASAPFTFTFTTPAATVINVIETVSKGIDYGSTTMAVTFDAIPANGQLIILWVGEETTAKTITPPAGFTAVPGLPVSYSTGYLALRTYYKFASSEASATYTVTWGSGMAAGRLAGMVLNNVHPTTPLDIAQLTQVGPWPELDTPAVTSVTAGTLHIGTGIMADNIFTREDPVDYTTAADGANRMRIMYRPVGAAGAIPTVQMGTAPSPLVQSLVLRPTTTPIPDTTPTAPVGLYAGPLHASVTLSWTPKFNGGDAVTDWSVQYRTTAGPGSWTEFSHVASPLNYITVTGLTNGTSYDFRVAGINGVGTGAYSGTTTMAPFANGPGIQFHDEFNRPDSSGLGANWLHESVHGWSHLDVVLHEMSGTQASESLGLYATQAGSTNQYAEVSKWEGSGEGGVVICATGAVGNWEDGYRITTRNWGTDVTLYKNATGVANWTAAGSGTQAYHRYRIQRSGNVITAYRDGALLGTYTDLTSPLTGRFFGLNIQGANSGLPRFDNFRGGEL